MCKNSNNIAWNMKILMCEIEKRYIYIEKEEKENALRK